MAKVTNNSKALQGVQTLTGAVYLQPGQTLDDLEFLDAEVAHLKTLQFIDIKGGGSSSARVERDSNGDTAGEAELRRMFDQAYEQQGSALKAATAGIEKLTADLAAKDGEITTLNDRVAELELENEELAKRIPAPAIPEAKHRGAGSYSIMEGDAELREKLTKDQAEAFNALDAVGKAKWLTDNPKPVA